MKTIESLSSNLTQIEPSVMQRYFVEVLSEGDDDNLKKFTQCVYMAYGDKSKTPVTAASNFYPFTLVDQTRHAYELNGVNNTCITPQRQFERNSENIDSFKNIVALFDKTQPSRLVALDTYMESTRQSKTTYAPDNIQSIVLSSCAFGIPMADFLNKIIFLQDNKQFDASTGTPSIWVESIVESTIAESPTCHSVVKDEAYKFISLHKNTGWGTVGAAVQLGSVLGLADYKQLFNEEPRMSTGVLSSSSLKECGANTRSAIRSAACVSPKYQSTFCDISAAPNPVDRYDNPIQYLPLFDQDTKGIPNNSTKAIVPFACFTNDPDASSDAIASFVCAKTSGTGWTKLIGNDDGGYTDGSSTEVEMVGFPIMQVKQVESDKVEVDTSDFKIWPTKPTNSLIKQGDKGVKVLELFGPTDTETDTDKYYDARKASDSALYQVIYDFPRFALGTNTACLSCSGDTPICNNIYAANAMLSVSDTNGYSVVYCHYPTGAMWSMSNIKSWYTGKGSQYDLTSSALNFSQLTTSKQAVDLINAAGTSNTLSSYKEMPNVAYCAQQYFPQVIDIIATFNTIENAQPEYQSSVVQILRLSPFINKVIKGIYNLNSSGAPYNQVLVYSAIGTSVDACMKPYKCYKSTGYKSSGAHNAIDQSVAQNYYDLSESVCGSDPFPFDTSQMDQAGIDCLAQVHSMVPTISAQEGCGLNSTAGVIDSVKCMNTLTTSLEQFYVTLSGSCIADQNDKICGVVGANCTIPNNVTTELKFDLSGDYSNSNVVLDGGSVPIWIVTDAEE